MDKETFACGDEIVDECIQEELQLQPDEESVDEVTGASPGTAQACADLGLNSLKENIKRLGIKPPGVA